MAQQRPAAMAHGQIQPPARLSARISDMDAVYTISRLCVVEGTAAMAHGPARPPAWLSAKSSVGDANTTEPRLDASIMGQVRTDRSA